MIGIAHGYGLGGSGSNLWTREAVAALCSNGETVHLLCQESQPERFDFVSEHRVYHPEGWIEPRFERAASGPGRCVVHRPVLELLPTYVRPDRPSTYVRSILDLADEELEAYVTRNLRVLRAVSREHGVRAWHVNHAVLLSEALRRLRAEDGVPFGVMPHGSALEYVVRHDVRMQRVARRVLEDAAAVFSLNQEIRERLAVYFPELGLEEKMVTVPVGVDTDRFRPVPPARRAERVAALSRDLEGVDRGRTPGHAAVVAEAAGHARDREEFDARVQAGVQHAPAPDAELEARLGSVHWEAEPVVAFVGRLIPAKGVAALVAAFPLILESHPHARLLVVGTGWLRDYLEAFLLALTRGEGERARQVLGWARETRQEGARPYATDFLDDLRAAGRYEGYVQTASHVLTPGRVLFTGYLEHHLLAHVFPLADVAVFPSAVAEASPLVIPEAAACGCLPMGTDFAGMRHSLDALARHLPKEVRPLMRLRAEGAGTGQDIVRNVRLALDGRGAAREALREAAVRAYDWRSIARDLARHLAAMPRAG